MAIAGSGGWIPSVRVSLQRRALKLSPPFHNVPPQAVWMPEQAAARFIDDPKAFIYVPVNENGGLDYLHDLLVELDLIDSLSNGAGVRAATPTQDRTTNDSR